METEIETEGKADGESDDNNEDTNTTTTNATTVIEITTTNRLFLSHVNYKNYGGDQSRRPHLSQEEVKKELKVLFSFYGTVQDVYLSEGKKLDSTTSTTTTTKHHLLPSPFGFVAMETTEEAKLAINAMTKGTPSYIKAQLHNNSSSNTVSDIRKRLLRIQLFRDIAPAKTYKSKHNAYNKKERKQKHLWKEYRERRLFIRNDNDTNTKRSSSANIICQVSTSHMERFKDYVLNSSSTSDRTTIVKFVGCVAIQKCTSLLLLRVDDSNKDNYSKSDGIDYLERFSQRLWDTWYVAPNLNRITIVNVNNDSDIKHILIEGNIRKGVIPAIFNSIDAIHLKKLDVEYDVNDDTIDWDVDPTIVTPLRVRVAVFPPKLQTIVLQELDNYLNNMADHLGGSDMAAANAALFPVEFTPKNPTHTISIIQLHPGVDVVNGNDNDKEALYVLGRLETNQFINSNHAKKITKQNVSMNNSRGEKHNNNNKEESTSISRAYWKLQEAWE